MSRRPARPQKSRWLLALSALALLIGIIVAVRRLSGGPTAAPAASAAAASSSVPGKRSGSKRDLSPSVVTSVDADPVGAFSLEGQVINTDEAAEGNAVVTLSTSPPRTTLSDETSGVFKFDKLPGAQYTLVARKGDLFAGPVTFRITDKMEPVVLRMARSPGLDLSVLRASDRTPLAGASYEVRGMMVVSGQTGVDGKANVAGLPPETYTVVAWAEGFGKVFQSVTVPSSGKAATIEIALSKASSAEGHVLNTRGDAVAGALVSFERTSDSAYSAAGPDARADGVRSDADGRFRFDSIAVGTYRFIAQHDQYAPGTTPPLTLDGRRDRTDIRIELASGASVAGRVLSRSGEPVPWATVVATPHATSFGGDLRARRQRADARGEFKLLGLPPALLDLVASSELGSSEITLVDMTKNATQTNVILTLKFDGEIAGVVTDQGGALVPEAQITAIPDIVAGTTPASPASKFVQDVADSGGRFRLRGLPNGQYRLHASGPGARASRRYWSDSDVVAKVGDTNVRLTLKSNGSIRGKVALANGGAPSLYTASVSFGPSRAFAAADGAFQIDDVDPGRTELVIGGPSFGPSVVSDLSIEPGKVLDVGVITVKAGRSIGGRVLTRAGKPVAGAQVFTGDRILGDGNGLTTETWGSSSVSATKSTTSEEDGSFTILGMGERSLALIADHPTYGRSAMVRIPQSSESQNVDLLLIPTSSLEGVVTRAGVPVGDVHVNASPKHAGTKSNQIVQAGPDGKFRFDRLASDEYLVSAILGATSISGVAMVGGVLCKVAEDATATANIELGLEPVLVTVNARLPDGTTQRMSEIHMLPMSMPPKTLSSAIHDALDSMTAGTSGYKIEFTGQPSKWRMPPGNYSLCVIPYPSTIAAKGKDKTSAYVEKHVHEMAGFCAPIVVGLDPGQTFVIDVVDPVEIQDGAPGGKAP